MRKEYAIRKRHCHAARVLQPCLVKVGQRDGKMEEVEARAGDWVVQEYRKRYILSDIAFRAILHAGERRS